MGSKVPETTYRRNVVVALVAMLYSTYALYASGKDAVLGGMLVTAIAFIIWGFLAPRFAPPAVSKREQSCQSGLMSEALTKRRSTMQRARLDRPHGLSCSDRNVRDRISRDYCAAARLAAPASAATLDRVRQTGKLTLGYRADARPFSYRDEAGNPDGYAVALCKEVAEQDEIRSRASPTLTVEWVPVTVEDQFKAVQESKVDLLCGAADTLTSRKDVDFSIPIFPGGIGAVLRATLPSD